MTAVNNITKEQTYQGKHQTLTKQNMRHQVCPTVATLQGHLMCVLNFTKS